MADIEGYRSVGGLEIVLFSFTILSAFVALLLVALFTHRVRNQKRPLSPYTGKPLWRGEEVPLSSVTKIMKFLYYRERSYDNRVFPMKRALVCRDTGRIFPFAVSWWGEERVDWSFLQKRHPGIYISWGSLTEMQKHEIAELHGTLEGFQVEHSSKQPLPKMVEPEYAMRKPGPLYVDLETKVLLGWKCVPDTIFEVLVVQKPGRYKKGPIDRIIQKRVVASQIESDDDEE